MFANLRQKWNQFMQGRYGNDELNRTLTIVVLVLIVLQLFLSNTILSGLCLVLLILLYFRMFSRNVSKRYQENRLYLEKSAGLRKWLARQKYELSQRREFHIYKCPSCRQKIRVPRGKGRIAIRCRKCGNEFIKKS